MFACGCAGTGGAAASATRMASVGHRRERTVGGYRKARNVRPLEGLEILNLAEPGHFHAAGVAQHDLADFAGPVAALFAGADQRLFHLAAVVGDRSEEHTSEL